MLTIYGILGGVVVFIGGLIGAWFHGKSTGVAQEKVNTDAAKKETVNVITQSQIADAQVKQAAADQTAQVDAVIKSVDARVDAMPDGEASKELFAKYGVKDANQS